MSERPKLARRSDGERVEPETRLGGDESAMGGDEKLSGELEYCTPSNEGLSLDTLRGGGGGVA